MTLYTKDELRAQSLTELKSLAEDHDIEFDGKPTKLEIITELMKITSERTVDETELDDEVEDDDELDEDELDDEELDDDEIDEIVSKPVAKAAKASKATAAKPAKAKAAKAPRAEGEGELLAAKQVATMLGTEAKTLRQFFRSPASTLEAVGSGGRYEFTEADVPQIKLEFDAWRAGHAARGASRAAGKKGSTPTGKAAVSIEEVEEIEELELDDDEELDDEELDD